VTSASSKQPLDRHVRRSGDDYKFALLNLLPQGYAWSRAFGTTLERTVNGLAQYWGFVDSRAADLLERESDPRKTIELLPDWERAWGLPDPCFPSATTISERQRMLVMKMTWLGGQSRQYFTDVLEWLGYTVVTIKEFSPFMAGISQVGDTRTPPPDSPVEDQNYRWYIGPPEQRFVWTVNIGQIGLMWFRSASGQAGVNHHLEFKIPTEVQCLLDRWKPAHTILVPDFSQMAAGGPMQGTP
jgi:uncharacterized protein YmfQ (DUF2313 family)